MIKDKRIEWCIKHCIDFSGNSYIENLDFNDKEFIKINTHPEKSLHLEFNGEQLPDFIKFKVKELCKIKNDIYLQKCPHLKSWEGLPGDNIEEVWLGSELENINHMPICMNINHSFIENQEEKYRANKKLRIKQWQKFKSKVLEKLQEQNPYINILDYQDGIKWLAIHDEYFYKNIVERKISICNNEININEQEFFESIIAPPSIKIKINSNFFSELHIDDNFDYSLGEKLMNNLFCKKKIHLKRDFLSEEDFLKIVEEKTKHNIIESKTINRKHPLKK